MSTASASLRRRPAFAVPALRALGAWLRPSPALAFMARVMLALALALYAAYALELDSPASAGVTVIVVMNASRGAIISKSLWRVFGSMVGAAAAVVLIALFVQTPVVFICGLAAWIGVCTFVGSLLRFNRSYAAVLAGYTVTLVAFGAIAEPNRIFQLATGRVAVVTIGVVSTALVFMVTDRGPGRRVLEHRVAGLVAAAATLLRDALRSGDFAAATNARRVLASELAALDQLVEFAAVEDAGFGRFKGDLRVLVAELLRVLTGGLHAVALVRHAAPATASTVEVALAAIAGLGPDDAVAPGAAVLEDAIASLHADAARGIASPCPNLEQLAAADQAAALLGQLGVAIASLHALQSGLPSRAPVRLQSYVNPVTACRNGVRAGLAILIAGLFWIFSQWPDGGAMLALLGPVCALVSQTDSAAQGSIDFLKGTILATLGGFACTYLVLPQMSGFPLLMAGMLPFVAAGLLLSRVPRYATVGLAFLVFFVGLVGATNPMRYNLAASLNTYVAFIVGGACAALSFRVLLPPNLPAEAAVLANAVRRAVRRQATRRRLPPPLVWEHLQHQKVLRLSRRLAAFPARRDHAVGGCIAALVAGRHLADFRRAAADHSLPEPARLAAGRVVAAGRRLLAAPNRAAAQAAADAAALALADASPAVLRLAAALQDFSAVVHDHAGFLAGYEPEHALIQAAAA